MTAPREPGRDDDLRALSEPTWYEDDVLITMIQPCRQRDEAIRLTREARDERDALRDGIRTLLHEASIAGCFTPVMTFEQRRLIGRLYALAEPKP